MTIGRAEFLLTISFPTHISDMENTEREKKDENVKR